MNNNVPITPISFIHKYKPQLIEEFNLDPELENIIKSLLDINSVNLLIIGSPNSGKTTLLYSLIRYYYNIPKWTPILENNILFINNLKEQGIQFFRTEMKIFCQTYSSIPGKKKLIIVDDIDTINEQSQQVFRSYIDKYENNIAFISVCTNIQKVIESLQSRLHLLKLPQPTTKQCSIIMNNIILDEKIRITPDAKEYLLNCSNESVRNIITHLEKMFILDKEIDLELCKLLCFNISIHIFENYINLLLNSGGAGAAEETDLKHAGMLLYNIYFIDGYSVIDILEEFFTFIKLTNLLSEEQKYNIIPFICQYIMNFHLIHEDAIELFLFTNSIYNFLKN